MPLLSVGVNITVKDKKIEDMSGEVITARVGDRLCLQCLHRISPTKVASERHPDQGIREALVKRGYVTGSDVKEPAVKTLNTMVATLAVEALLNQYTGVRRHVPILVYENNGAMSLYEDREVWPPHPNMPLTGGGGIATSITHLLSRLQDELSAQHFVRVADASLYGRTDLFGPAVAKKFKAATADIENAGNCLAVGQATACVFHLMRAMEIAVRQLGKRLKVTITPQTTWRQMTGNMDPKIKAMPEATERQKKKKNDWEAARSNLHHVGSVWRNNTMHPAASYTQSQARDVINAVRVFMNGLCAL